MKQVSSQHGMLSQHWVGDGFPVRTLLLPNTADGVLNPFLMLDYAGPTYFPPATQPRGVGEHPHRGFETVTLVYQGEVSHRDSSGGGGTIGPGDVQWMTAASGVVHDEFHSEAFTRQGGMMEMVQLWVNLPAAQKMRQPGYQTLLDAQFPRVTLPGGQGEVRVIAGEWSDAHGVLTGPAHHYSELNLWDARLQAGADLLAPVPDGQALAVVVLEGEVTVADVTVQGPQVVVLSAAGAGVRLQARSASKVVLLAGVTLQEPIASHGPFVMNTQQEIRQAIMDYQQGKFGQLPIAEYASSAG
ncbi:pirin family protein [Leeia aquatica]|uniref:Pirin family protein n=1 Tax=Leeia aquatica TaxID=2725557 RepID=A0A847SIQ5_9NEIS|nr:pirin family protein [Leeia aquatica]NLR75772.1 pirin family protein [Leeia aquatica]